MFNVVESVDIERSPQDVFALLADPARRSEWDASVVSERLLTPPPLASGSALVTQMRVLGRTVEYEWEVTHFEPPKVMEVTSVSGPMATRSRIEIEPTSGGCRVTATVEANPTGMLRLGEPIVAESVRSTLATGLARARDILNADGPSRRVSRKPPTGSF